MPQKYRKRAVFTFLALLSGPVLAPSALLAETKAAEVASGGSASVGQDSGSSTPKATFPWHSDIVTTFFFIGKDQNSVDSMTNFSSAWDAKWQKNYGGSDDSHSGLLPSKFAPTQNPFYVALPFNDVAYPDMARKFVPWYSHAFYKSHPYISQCKGHWIEIRNRDGKCAYAQWQDVGPLRTDHATYVFGDDKPHDFNRAGLDVSPAVRDYLGLAGLDVTDWRFVNDEDVPGGPWRIYAEQAVIYAALKQKEQQLAEDWHPAKHLPAPTDE